ncbi:MAG: HlyD family efflux transporter periplasmic adaptor subunit [Synechococcales cyanobacterium M58_A2018_015]|nr:HlyD family efflux transporter periplasmic adaptor subunit [Synechococcales cyanobacterium M58_A2018_015]
MKPTPLPDPPTNQTNPDHPTSVAARNQVRRGWQKRLPQLSPKQWGYLMLAIATLILVVWAFQPAPVRVDVGTVEQGRLQVTVEAEGKTRLRDRYTIAAPVNGHLERITLNPGDRVQPGTLVARIEPLPLTAAVEEALGRLAEWKAQRAGVETQRPKTETLAQATLRIQKAEADHRQAAAQVAQAQAALEQAQRDRERAQQLEASGAIPRKDRELAELNETTKAKELEASRLAAKAAASEVEVARAALAVLQQERSDPDYLLRVYDARIASTEAELAKLRDDANRTDIRSPIQGQVIRVLQKSAQYVTQGTPLLELGDVSHLELVIDVLSSDAEQIQPGAAIWIERQDAPPLQARVRQVEPGAFTKVSALGVEEQRVNVIGDFVDTPPSLGDAYRVESHIVVWEGNNVVKVPLSALFRCEQEWCVFVVHEHRAQQRSVAVGRHSHVEAEIRHGLTAGDIVILHPNEQITPGKRVAIR